jgi:hypothetical protein
MTASAKQVDHRFYLWPAVAAFAVVIGGFARTYYLKLAFGTPALPWLLHLHGALMTAWFLLFFVQVNLVATRHITAHRRLGVAGAVLAGSIVLVGASVAIHAGARDRLSANTGCPPALALMGFFLVVLLVFAVLVGTALLRRRRRDWHSRLMLLSCVALLGPSLSRIPFEQVPALSFLKSGGPAGVFSLDLLLIYGCITWDTWRNRRVHPAFLVGAVLIMAYDSSLIWIFLTGPMWTHVATWLVT